LKISETTPLHPLSVTAEVIWVKEEKNNSFVCGLCFTKIEDEEKFTNYLCEEMLNITFDETEEY
jgi:hypothetical protein